MKWFRRKRRQLDVIATKPRESVVSDPAEALRLSQEALAEAQSWWPAVRAVTRSHRSLREENHFSERIRESQGDLR